MGLVEVECTGVAPRGRTDLAEDDKADCFDDRLPAADDSNLPEWAKGKTYFGKPSVYDGDVYEDEYRLLATIRSSLCRRKGNL